jgi:hypothetical protein
MQRGAARRGQGASIAHSCEDTGLVVARSGPGGSPRAVMATRTPRPRSTEDLAQPGAPGPPWCACDHKQLRAGWIAVCGRYSIRHKGRMSKWKRRCDARRFVPRPHARLSASNRSRSVSLPSERNRRRTCTPDVLWILVTTLRRLRAVRIYRKSYFAVPRSPTRLRL